LPRGYHVPGVRHPNCCNVRNDSDRVEFVLTRGRIRALAAQGVRNGAGRLGTDPGDLPQALN